METPTCDGCERILASLHSLHHKVDQQLQEQRFFNMQTKADLEAELALDDTSIAKLQSANAALIAKAQAIPNPTEDETATIAHLQSIRTVLDGLATADDTASGTTQPNPTSATGKPANDPAAVAAAAARAAQQQQSGT